jgi:BirA family biotin operon repressor/biotin-[acetyl-CoA-carboxylase] ligase
LSGSWRIVCLHEVGSTNDVALRAGERGIDERLAVFAEVQTAGRGRMGRRWEVPRGCGLLCSTLWRPRVPPESAGGLAQVAGVAVVQALGAMGIAARLRWPNDVLLGDAKCGGILIESALEAGWTRYAVVGVGLNVLQTAPELPATPYRATSVWLATGRVLERAELAARLLDALADRYAEWLADPRHVFEAWRGVLATLGQRVELVGATGRFRGEALDVEPDGALLVRRDGGSVERVVSGEVSGRA